MRHICSFHYYNPIVVPVTVYVISKYLSTLRITDILFVGGILFNKTGNWIFCIIYSPLHHYTLHHYLFTIARLKQLAFITVKFKQLVHSWLGAVQLKQIFLSLDFNRFYRIIFPEINRNTYIIFINLIRNNNLITLESVTVSI